MIVLELTEREARALVRGAEFHEVVMENVFDHQCESTKIRRTALTKLVSAIERQEVAP